MSDINPFISAFCRSAANGGLSRNRRARLSSALRKAIEVELPARDDRVDIQIRSLQNSDQLTPPMRDFSEHSCVFPADIP